MDALLDYYDGAYGPTIRFDSDSVEDLNALRETCRRLAKGEVRDVPLHRMEGLSVSNLEALTLALVEVEPKVTLKRLKGRSFLWANTREGWRRCCGQIDSLIAFDKPGHQYLTNEGIDDALIELCLYERADRRPRGP